MIIYRRPAERDTNAEKIQLDNRALKHIPLLEGEEKIKFLHLQNNEIQKIENLVSLPNLHFLDLSNNKLVDISNIQGVLQLRVLILSKNLISTIQKNNFDSFKQLDVLDLHDNRISGRLDFSCYLKKLTNLRILNLSGNQIEEVEMTFSMKSLVELNLRGNKIKNLKIGLNVKGLKEIQFDQLAKIYLSNNQIKDFDSVVTDKSMLAQVTELTLENNPIEKDAKLQQKVQEKFPGLSQSSLQKMQTVGLQKSGERASEQKDSRASTTLKSPRDTSLEPKDAPTGGVGHVVPKSGNTAAKRKAQENAVIKIIQKEWERETERLDFKKNG